MPRTQWTKQPPYTLSMFDWVMDVSSRIQIQPPEKSTCFCALNSSQTLGRGHLLENQSSWGSAERIALPWHAMIYVEDY